MNGVIAMVVLAAAGAGEVEFDKEIVRYVLEKAIYHDMDVPFEVVGYKKLFAQVLNQARVCSDSSHKTEKFALTSDDIKELIDGASKPYSATVQVKLQHLINETLKAASKKIKADDLNEQVEWRKIYYDYTPDVSNRPVVSEIPLHIQAKVKSYIKHLDLEKPFELEDLKKYYKN